MNITDGIDNWTEDDFKLHQVEIPPVDDPWAVETRSSASDDAKSLLHDSEDKASSKEPIPAKSGIYVPFVDRIRPYVAPDSRRIDQKSTGAAVETETSGPISLPSELLQSAHRSGSLNLSTVDQRDVTKRKAAQVTEDPWGFQIPSNRPLPRNTTDSSQLSPDGSHDGDIDRSLELQDQYFDDYLGDEPEITAEYENDLHEGLFQTVDASYKIKRHLVIDEWLASVGALNDEILRKITETLMNFSIQRFTYWMNWLQNQSWDELALIKFFGFRQYYKFRKDYWQYFQWSRERKSWIRHENLHNFSLSQTLRLIECRIHLPVNQMIEDEWLDDWGDLDVSYLYANKCLKFSDFALYRSQLNYGEDWKRRIDLGFDFESDLILMTRDGGIRRFTPGRRLPYDQSEPTPSFDSDAWLEKFNARNARDLDNL